MGVHVAAHPCRARSAVETFAVLTDRIKGQDFLPRSLSHCECMLFLASLAMMIEPLVLALVALPFFSTATHASKYHGQCTNETMEVRKEW